MPTIVRRGDGDAIAPSPAGMTTVESCGARNGTASPGDPEGGSAAPPLTVLS
jgi:hypothetical protein